MGTEIQGEYTVSETEVDFAMKYADERKKSMKLESRLMALLYETIAQHELMVGLVESLARADGDQTSYCMKKFTEWRVDTEAIVYLNLFRPAGDQKFLRDDHVKYKALELLPPGVMEEIKQRLATQAKIVFEEWVDYAKAHGFTPTALIREHYAGELQKLVKETMEKGGLKEADQAVKH